MCYYTNIARQLVLLLWHFAFCSGHMVDPWHFRALIHDNKFWHRLICGMSILVALSAIRSYCDHILKYVPFSFLTTLLGFSGNCVHGSNVKFGLASSVPIFRSVWMFVLFQCTQFALVVVVSSKMRCFLWKLFLNSSNTSIALTIFYVSRVVMKELTDL